MILVCKGTCAPVAPLSKVGGQCPIMHLRSGVPAYRRQDDITCTSHSWGGLLALAGVLEKNAANSHLSPGHSIAEYCAPACCCSAHTRLLDPVINDASRTVTGCLRPTPADNLPILVGIQPAELRCKGAKLSLARRAMEPGHILHLALTYPSRRYAWHLKSSHPFVPAAQRHMNSSDENNRSAALWADHQ